VLKNDDLSAVNCWKLLELIEIKIGVITPSAPGNCSRRRYCNFIKFNWCQVWLQHYYHSYHGRKAGLRGLYSLIAFETPSYYRSSRSYQAVSKDDDDLEWSTTTDDKGPQVCLIVVRCLGSSSGIEGTNKNTASLNL
jgi:hypothetical protein